RNQLRFGVEDKVHIISGIEWAGHVRKVMLVHFLHLFDLRALFLKLGFQSIDDLLDCVLLALRIQDKQRFITVFHASSVLLKVFIAEMRPLSIAHFTASTARSIVDRTIGFSSSKKRLNT